MSKQIQIPLTGAYNGQYCDAVCSGSGESAVVFSNMDTNDPAEWKQMVEAVEADGKYMAVTYTYPEQADDQSGVLTNVIDYLLTTGVQKIVLVGASRGGVASVKVTGTAADEKHIAGVVAMSAPIEYDGLVFYDAELLKRIDVPALLINSEQDEGAEDTRKMYQLLNEPKEMLIYSGDAHGTQLFIEDSDSLIERISGFIDLAMEI